MDKRSKDSLALLLSMGSLYALVGVGAGCGGGPAPAATTPEHATHRTTEEEPTDSVAITGLMGTISQENVRAGLEGHMTNFARCFSARMSAVEFLSGDITMSFRIDTDGHVLWVYPSASTIGDRDTEQCVLDIARRSHFSHPHGGEAEFTWGFGLEAAEDVRLPTSWPETHVADTVSENRSGLGSCGRTTGFQITAYVAPGGTVMAAGGTAPDADSLAALDCVVTAVRGWQMPDPGSYAAKVTFSI